MIKNILCFALVSLLSACTLSHRSQVETKWSVTEEHLANGSSVKMGSYTPAADWNCKTVGRQTYKWSMLQFEGTFKSLTGGLGLLHKKALEYANQQKLKTNYIYYHLPNTTSLNDFDLSAMTGSDNVDVIFYQCQKVNV